MRNRLRALFALLVPLALVAACGNDDTATETGDDGDAEAPGEELTLGAPQDCETNPFCIPGLQRVYGVDLSDGFTPLDPGLIGTSLEEGAIDVALLFSTDGRIAANDWVLLEDDEGMLAADNVVPVISDALAEAYGDELASLVNSVSAELTTDHLIEMNRRYDIDRDEAGQIAADWIEENLGDLDPGTVSGDGPPIRIGAQDFGESSILAELYGQVLQDAGYSVEQVAIGGFRDLLLSAYDAGDVNFSAEYAASMLEFLNDQAGEATSDAAETTERLQEHLDERGLVALEPSDAVNTNAFVVTQDTADRLGVRTLSDLADI